MKERARYFAWISRVKSESSRAKSKSLGVNSENLKVNSDICDWLRYFIVITAFFGWRINLIMNDRD